MKSFTMAEHEHNFKRRWYKGPRTLLKRSTVSKIKLGTVKKGALDLCLNVKMRTVLFPSMVVSHNCQRVDERMEP